MNPKPIQAIKCPECGNLFPKTPSHKFVKAFECSECQTIYFNKDYAEECCRTTGP